jgi:putative tricarboxylic transport membrane protein
VKSNDFYSSLVCLLVGLSFVGGGLSMGVGPMDSPGPGFFPVVIGAIFTLLSAGLFITAFPGKDQLPASGSFWKNKDSWKKVVLSLGSLVFYLIALNYLGYLVTTMLFILYLLKDVGRGKWTLSILMAVLITLASYALFRLGLRVPLPQGVIGI